MNNNFKAALTRFLHHELDFAELSRIVEQEAQLTPAAIPDMLAHIKDLQEAQQLPMQDYARLNLHILQVKKQAKSQAATASGSVLPIGQRHQWREPAEWSEEWHAEALFAAEPEAVLKGSFRLKQRLSGGPEGELWRAVDLLQDERAQHRQIGVFLINPALYSHAGRAFKALLSDFPQHQQFNHPQRLGVHDLGREGGSVFVIVDLPAGPSLRDLLDSKPTGIPLHGLRELLEALAQLLDAACQAQLFPYLSPQTLFYDPVQKTLHGMDFGLIHLALGQNQSEPLAAEDCLSMGYLSCRMLTGLHQPDLRDAVYSLACIAYELLSGRHPFAGHSCLEAREKQYQANPPQGLSGKQWHSLHQALSFDYNQRPASSARLLGVLFPRQNLLPLALGGAALVGLLGLGLVYLNTTVWEYQRVRESVIRGEAEGVARLQSWDSERQLRVLEGSDKAVSQALLDYYQQQQEGDVLEQFGQFSTPVRTQMLSNANVKARLLTHYRGQLENLMEQDDFSSAHGLARRVQEVYPEAASWLVDVKLRQGRRQAELERNHQACLAADSSLHAKTPCLLETRAGLARLDPRHPLLNNAQLAELYRQQAEEFLLESAYPQVRELLTDWEQLLPDAAPERDTLIWQLQRSQDIEEKLKQNDFYGAFDLVREATALYPETDKFKHYELALDKLIEQRIEALEQLYVASIDKEELLPREQADDVFDFRNELARLDPEHPLLSDPLLHKAFFTLITETAADAEQDSLPNVRALFDTWLQTFNEPRYVRPLHEEYLERAKNRVALLYLLQAEQRQRRDYAEFALQLNPVDSVQDKLKALLESLPKAEAEPVEEAQAAG